MKRTNNEFEPTKKEVDAWWYDLDYGVQMEIVEQIYPDGNIGTEGWKHLDWSIKLEIYEENSLED